MSGVSESKIMYSEKGNDFHTEIKVFFRSEV